MTERKNENETANEAEHKNVVMNRVIDAVKIGGPMVAGAVVAAVKVVPKIVKLVKR